MSENIKLAGAIGREIAACGELDGLDWVEVSAIFGVDEDGDVNTSYGYAYDRSNAVHAVAFLYDPVERAVKDYREWLRGAGDKGFDRILFQLNRLNGKFNADFAYDDSERWRVTPANIDTIAEVLRPRLGE